VGGSEAKEGTVSGQLNGWALVLGASSGFGEATGLALARAGMHIFGVHLDRKGTLANVERIVGEIRGMGREAHFWNMNAADEEKRREALDQMGNILKERSEEGGVKVLLHSLAFGTLKPFITPNPSEAINKAQMDMTVDVMAHSLVFWVQDLVWRGLMREGGKVFAMTSSGGQQWVLP
jgi:NAD(P)-dependent dehydrogenase (short-subunit alcohol dehydrogenase family)